MSMAPDDLMQWSNDAFHYADAKVAQPISTQMEESAGYSDFHFLVSLALLVIKMVECAVSAADQNILEACRQHAVCESYATAGSRWVFTLTDFPFSSILEAGQVIQRKTMLCTQINEKRYVIRTPENHSTYLAALFLAHSEQNLIYVT